MEIDARSLQQKLSSDAPPLLVDVRTPLEVQAEGAIAGSLLIPLDQLPARLGEVPQDREVVTVCKRGARSFNAANWLRAMGRNALSLHGGIDLWKAMGLPVKK